MKTYAFAGAALGALALAAAASADDPTPTKRTRNVEWPAGAQAAADAIADRVFPAGASSAFADSPIPVLAPQGIESEEARAFLKTYRSVKNGFFATIPGSAYDVVINGTQSFAVAPAAATVVERGDRKYLFEFGEIGAHISFSKFGVDYLVEFNCHETPSLTKSCVTQDEAVAFVDKLQIVGGGG